MSRLDPNHRLPDPAVLILHLDDPRAWQCCCELVLALGIRDGLDPRITKPLSEDEIRSELSFNVRGRNGHFHKLRLIYGAAFSGARLMWPVKGGSNGPA